MEENIKEKYMIIPEKIFKVYHLKQYYNVNQEKRKLKKYKEQKKNSYLYCNLCKANFYLNYSEASKMNEHHTQTCPMANIEHDYLPENKDKILNLYIIQFSTFKNYKNLPSSSSDSYFYFNNSVKDTHFYKITRRNFKKNEENIFYAYCVCCGNTIYKAIENRMETEIITNEEFVKCKYEKIYEHAPNCLTELANIQIDQKVIPPEKCEFFYSIPFLLEIKEKIRFKGLKNEFNIFSCDYLSSGDNDYFNFIQKAFLNQKISFDQSFPIEMSNSFKFCNLQPSIENVITLLFNELSKINKRFYFSSQYKSNKLNCFCRVGLYLENNKYQIDLNLTENCKSSSATIEQNMEETILFNKNATKIFEDTNFLNDTSKHAPPFSPKGNRSPDKTDKNSNLKLEPNLLQSLEKIKGIIKTKVNKLSKDTQSPLSPSLGVKASREKETETENDETISPSKKRKLMKEKETDKNNNPEN